MIKTFANFEDFKKNARQLGLEVDLSELFSIEIAFLETYGQFVLVSIKDYAKESSGGGGGNLILGDNILVLSEKDSFLYSRNKAFGEEDYKLFKHTLQKQYGEPTVLTFLALREVLNSYLNAFNAMDQKIDDLERKYDAEDAEQTTVRLRRLTNKVEDLANLLIILEERKIKQVYTGLIAYDYDLLKSRAQHLLDRCRNHLGQLRDIQTEAETKQSRQSMTHLQTLSTSIKRITALVVVVFVTLLIAINFEIAAKYFPDLQSSASYANFLIVDVLAVAVLLFFFRRNSWV